MAVLFKNYRIYVILFALGFFVLIFNKAVGETNQNDTHGHPPCYPLNDKIGSPPSTPVPISSPPNGTGPSTDPLPPDPVQKGTCSCPFSPPQDFQSIPCIIPQKECVVPQNTIFQNATCFDPVNNDFTKNCTSQNGTVNLSLFSCGIVGPNEDCTKKNYQWDGKTCTNCKTCWFWKWDDINMKYIMAHSCLKDCTKITKTFSCVDKPNSQLAGQDGLVWKYCDSVTDQGECTPKSCGIFKETFSSDCKDSVPTVDTWQCEWKVPNSGPLY